METFLGYTIVGVSIAAIYAVSATGLVLTYTTTGLFNFGHGAIGMLSAFCYWQLHVEWSWPTPVAVLVVLAGLAPVAGIGLEALTRDLADTSDATKLLVSVALMFGMLGLSQAIWDPAVGRSVPQFFAGSTVDLGVTTVTYHQVTTLIVAVVVAASLRGLLYGARLGVAMRATVDDRRLAVLTGISTSGTRRLSWVVGTVLAAASGVLVASTAGLNATVLSLLIVNAYAAAVFGRLRSLPLTFAGALAVGLADGYLQGYLPQNQYLAGLRLASPVIVLFVALMIFPQRRLRPYVGLREYFPPPSRRGTIGLGLGIVALGVVLATTLSDGDVITYGKVFAMGIVGLSLVPLMGFANQVSLCQLTFAGIGALTMAQVGDGGNPLGLLAAAGVAALVGVLVALPALRLSGIYLALATAAFAVAMDRWIFFLPPFHIGSTEVSLFGTGSVSVDRLDLFGWQIASDRSQVVLGAVVLALLTAGVAWLRTSRYGRRLVAIRDSEAACATFGMNLVATRVSVFALSAAIAGLGGALLGMQAGTVEAGTFEFVSGLPVFMAVALAGAGVVSAGLASGLSMFGALPFLSASVSWFARWQSLGVGLLAAVVGREPSGTSALVGRARRARRDRRADTRADTRPEPEPALEWLGVTEDWPVAAVDHVERELHLEEFGLCSTSRT